MPMVTTQTERLVSCVEENAIQNKYVYSDKNIEYTAWFCTVWHSADA